MQRFLLLRASGIRRTAIFDMHIEGSRGIRSYLSSAPTVFHTFTRDSTAL